MVGDSRAALSTALEPIPRQIYNITCKLQSCLYMFFSIKPIFLIPNYQSRIIAVAGSERRKRMNSAANRSVTVRPMPTANS